MEAVGRVVVKYFDASVGWVRQQQKQLEQHEQFEQQQQQLELQQLELQQLVQRQRKKLKTYQNQNWEGSLWVLENIMQDRPFRCRVCARWAGRCRVCRGSLMSTRT